jgi:hypothetical protein
VGFGWERGDFRRGHSSHNDKVGRVINVHHAGLASGYRQGVVGGWLMELGVRAGERKPETILVSRAAHRHTPRGSGAVAAHVLVHTSTRHAGVHAVRDQ